MELTEKGNNHGLREVKEAGGGTVNVLSEALLDHGSESTQSQSHLQSHCTWYYNTSLLFFPENTHSGKLQIYLDCLQNTQCNDSLQLRTLLETLMGFHIHLCNLPGQNPSYSYPHFTDNETSDQRISDELTTILDSKISRG